MALTQKQKETLVEFACQVIVASYSGSNFFMYLKGAENLIETSVSSLNPNIKELLDNLFTKDFFPLLESENPAFIALFMIALTSVFVGSFALLRQNQKALSALLKNLAKTDFDTDALREEISKLGLKEKVLKIFDIVLATSATNFKTIISTASLWIYLDALLDRKELVYAICLVILFCNQLSQSALLAQSYNMAMVLNGLVTMIDTTLVGGIIYGIAQTFTDGYTPALAGLISSLLTMSVDIMLTATTYKNIGYRTWVELAKKVSYKVLECCKNVSVHKNEAPLDRDSSFQILVKSENEPLLLKEEKKEEKPKAYNPGFFQSVQPEAPKTESKLLVEPEKKSEVPCLIM